MLDSGSYFDIVKKESLSDKEAQNVQDSGTTFRMATASGRIDTNESVNVGIPQLGDRQDVVVLAGCPSILSLGRMCMERGYTFIWKSGKSPLLVTPNGRKMVLEVEDYVPVLACPPSSSSTAAATSSSSTSPDDKVNDSSNTNGKPGNQGADNSGILPPGHALTHTHRRTLDVLIVRRPR